MTKIASLACQGSVLLLTFLALSSLSVAQHTMTMEKAQNQSKLVRTVRNATQQYINVNNATAAGYGALFGCVSGTDHGAMGIHYVNPSLLNGTVNAAALNARQ